MKVFVIELSGAPCRQVTAVFKHIDGTVLASQAPTMHQAMADCYDLIIEYQASLERSPCAAYPQ